MSSAGACQVIGVAIIEYDGQYLVGVRGTEGPLAGFAEFPGGKCHPGETPAACAVRETLEETGLRVGITEPFHECRYDYPYGTVALHFFLCRPQPDERINEDHSGFRWLDALQLSELRFPPANAQVIVKLLDRQAGYSSGHGRIG